MNTVLSAVPTGACHSKSVNIDCRRTDRQTDTSTRYTSSLSHAHTIVIDSKITVDISRNSRKNTHQQTTEIRLHAFQFSRVQYLRAYRCWIQDYRHRSLVIRLKRWQDDVVCVITAERALLTVATNKMWLF